LKIINSRGINTGGSPESAKVSRFHADIITGGSLLRKGAAMEIEGVAGIGSAAPVASGRKIRDADDKKSVKTGGATEKRSPSAIEKKKKTGMDVTG
jgi:hypothetical protein